MIYYYCKSRATNTPQENCNSPYLRADQIEPMVWNTVKSILENPEEVFNTFRDESILNEERAKSIEGRLDYIDGAIKKLEVAKKRITEAFKAEAMTLPEFPKEKTDLELSEEKLLTERDALKMKLNVQHDVGAKIDLFKETCHKFLSKINDPKIVTERVKKDIIKLVIDRVVIEGESVKIFAMIPLPTKIHERELVKTDLPGTFNAGATLGPINETNMARIWNKHKLANTPLKKKVFVAMSGGVDSSVAALLLKNKGYDAVGVFMRCYNLDGCSEQDALDARRAAEHIGIPFYVWDFEEDYKKRVVEYMVDGYRRGITPNPDVMCNKEIKFGLFFEKALAAGADFVSTGHYVQMGTTKNEHGLFEAKDKNKDQSYFLWTLTQKQLKYCLFPIGKYKKPEVRAIARKAGLPTAEKKDSQGICFLGKISLSDFLKQYIPEKKGALMTASGEKIGEHAGAAFYTIGQRHLGASYDIKSLKAKGSGAQKPFYVAEKNVKKNTVTVAEGNDHPSLYKKEIGLADVNFISQAPSAGRKLPVFARVRYRQPLAKATLIIKKKTKASFSVSLIFDKPQKFVASGQSAVLYADENPSSHSARSGRNSGGLRMLGGGVIL